MKIMKLYMVRMRDKVEEAMPSHCDYTVALVIRADSSVSARKMAQKNAGRDELHYAGAHLWLDPLMTSCRKLGEATPGTQQDAGILCTEDRSHG